MCVGLYSRNKFNLNILPAWTHQFLVKLKWFRKKSSLYKLHCWVQLLHSRFPLLPLHTTRGFQIYKDCNSGVTPKIEEKFVQVTSLIVTPLNKHIKENLWCVYSGCGHPYKENLCEGQQKQISKINFQSWVIFKPLNASCWMAPLYY